MKNETAIKLLGLALLLVVIGLGLTFFVSSSVSLSIIGIGLGLGKIMGLILLISNGSLIRSIYWKVILFCLGALITGALFKIEHLPGASALILFSYIGIALTYSIWFFSKKQKSLLDVIKLSWVIFSCTMPILILEHLISSAFLAIPEVLFWLAVFLVVKTEIGFKELAKLITK